MLSNANELFAHILILQQIWEEHTQKEREGEGDRETEIETDRPTERNLSNITKNLS